MGDDEGDGSSAVVEEIKKLARLPLTLTLSRTAQGRNSHNTFSGFLSQLADRTEKGFAARGQLSVSMITRWWLTRFSLSFTSV